MSSKATHKSPVTIKVAVTMKRKAVTFSILPVHTLCKSAFHYSFSGGSTTLAILINIAVDPCVHPQHVHSHGFAERMCLIKQCAWCWPCWDENNSTKTECTSVLREKSEKCTVDL